MQDEKPIFHEAVKVFWGKQSSQLEKQIQAGFSDAGRRGEVTGGGHMDGFLSTLKGTLADAGIPPDHIYDHRMLAVLPGYYRPTKVWDLLVVDENMRVRVIIELKSISSSFGNNANNRAEEAVGNAKDLWDAFREGALGTHPEPWVGYLFVLKDCPETQKPVRIEEPHYSAFQEFGGGGKPITRSSKNTLAGRRSVVGVSYAKRLEWMCRRLMQERLYRSVCFLLVDPDDMDKDQNYKEPASDLSASTFIEQMIFFAKAP